MCDCLAETTTEPPVPTVVPQRLKDLGLSPAERSEIAVGSPFQAAVTKLACATLARDRAGAPRPTRWRDPECECSRERRIASLAAAQPLVAAVADSAKSPLPFALRRKFESALGVSLADVRMVNGAAATRATRKLNTVAYAHCDTIVIDETALVSDEEIDAQIAHELAHVLQQRTPGLAASRRRLEYEADAFAEALRVGAPPPRLSAAPSISLLLGSTWVECAPLCAGAGGGLEGVYFDLNPFLRIQGICTIDSCGTTVTPAIQALGWCVYSCKGEGKKWATFFIKTRCGFVGPSWVM